MAGLVAGSLAGAAHAVDLPEDRAETMYHLYDGGGTRASGPAVLVRKSMLDRASVEAGYYVDSVSNASIDVVTTASPYKETRDQMDLGVDYVTRDTLIKVSGSRSKEPDYLADTLNVDLTQDVFGGMTTVAMGFTKGDDKVGQHGTPGWIDTAHHWQYRLGVTQILTPRWLASVNLEAIADDGYLGSPYRVARVFGAPVPERDPRTRASHALKLSATGDITPAGAEHRSSVRAEYRYFWDTWNIRAHTLELGYDRYLTPRLVLESFLRYYRQGHALFYSDNAATETVYVSRNRQLSDFHDVSLGLTLTYTLRSVPGKYDLKLSGGYQRMDFHYADFTDIRTGRPYSFNANVMQTVLSATF
ncbi:MAG TPA: DUF3570 domain-containing protein [Burkholderiaceae bacterium]